VSWLGTKAHLVRFEELIRHITTLDTWEAEGFFQGLFDDCSMGELPDDWRERVRIGADRKQSGTARENLVGSMFEVPDQLPDVQKRLVDFAAPGLRSVLGYD
jgi:hypothetical protein